MPPGTLTSEPQRERSPSSMELSGGHLRWDGLGAFFWTRHLDPAEVEIPAHAIQVQLARENRPRFLSALWGVIGAPRERPWLHIKLRCPQLGGTIEASSSVPAERLSSLESLPEMDTRASDVVHFERAWALIQVLEHAGASFSSAPRDGQIAAPLPEIELEGEPRPSFGSLFWRVLFFNAPLTGPLWALAGIIIAASPSGGGWALLLITGCLLAIITRITWWSRSAHQPSMRSTIVEHVSLWVVMGVSTVLLLQPTGGVGDDTRTPVILGAGILGASAWWLWSSTVGKLLIETPGRPLDWLAKISLGGLESFLMLVASPAFFGVLILVLTHMGCWDTATVLASSPAGWCGVVALWYAGLGTLTYLLERWIWPFDIGTNFSW